MSYRSMNSLGFAGYQFGEALLIDLGYYQDDVNMGMVQPRTPGTAPGPAKTGSTLADFTIEAAQELAIQEAFDYKPASHRNRLGVSRGKSSRLPGDDPDLYRQWD